MDLKLKEMLWEITLQCNKNCFYCGSNGQLEPVTKCWERKHSEELECIAHAIAEYPPETITLTGGEPGVVPCLESIVDILRDAGISVRVVTNGTVFHCAEPTFLQKFDQIGLSINTIEDIETLTNNTLINKHRDNITIITNFGTHNIWDFDKIQHFATDFSLWQVQLTEGNKYQLTSEGIKHLYDKLSNADASTVMADNLQKCHTCMAGIQSCSVLVNGDVIGCLSERTWNKEITAEGNLINESLENIWETKFRYHRFNDKQCCRDFIDYPEEAVDFSDLLIQPFDENTQLVYGVSIPRDDDTGKAPWSGPQIVMYGVSSPLSSPRVYGVARISGNSNSELDNEY